MSINMALNAVPMVAAQDLRPTSLTPGLYRLLKLATGTSSSPLRVQRCAAATDAPIGILAMNPPSTESSVDREVRVALLNISGVMQVRLHGTAAAGAYLGVHTDGSVIATATPTAGNWYVGQAPKAGVAGEIISFVAMPFRA